MIPQDTDAVLFDIYGTLLDGPRRPDRGRRMSELASRFGLDADFAIDAALDEAIAEAHRQARAPWPEIDIREIWMKIFPALRDADAFALAIEEAVHPVEPTPWAASLLDEAFARRLPVGVVSNAQAYTRGLMARHFPGHWPRFRSDLLAFSYEHGIAKPDARLFTHALQPLLEAGIEPARIVMIGDSEEMDRTPAEALGLTFVGVAAFQSR